MPSTSTFAPLRFGRYILLARLGAGGMAVVHRAVQLAVLFDLPAAS